MPQLTQVISQILLCGQTTLTHSHTFSCTDDDKRSFIKRLSEYRWGRKMLLKITRFGYASAAGIIGAQSVMFAKGVALMLNEGIGDALQKWESYTLLTGMLVTIFLQIRWLNTGLQHFDALYIVPVFQAFWIGFSVIAGMIVYRESEEMSWLQLSIFGVGISITLVGVYSLSQRSGDIDQASIPTHAKEASVMDVEGLKRWLSSDAEFMSPTNTLRSYKGPPIQPLALPSSMPHEDSSTSCNT